MSVFYTQLGDLAKEQGKGVGNRWSCFYPQLKSLLLLLLFNYGFISYLDTFILVFRYLLIFYNIENATNKTFQV